MAAFSPVQHAANSCQGIAIARILAADECRQPRRNEKKLRERELVSLKRRAAQLGLAPARQQT
jgi:hypothetical protein